MLSLFVLDRVTASMGEQRAISQTYDIVAMIGISDQSCWLAEACESFLLFLLLLLQVGCASHA